MSNWKKKLRAPAGQAKPGPMDMTMFVDETGWTGANIADQNQRVVLYSGVLIPRERRAEFEAAVQAVIAAYPKMLAAEPKGADMIQSHRPLALDILKCCADFFAIFVVAGIDKLYQAACMIPYFIHDGGCHDLIKGTRIDSSLGVPIAESWRPDGWIDPDQIALCYYERLRKRPDVLTAFYRSVWPDGTHKGDPARVDDALKLVLAGR